jgi:hypothetical protein
MDKVCNNLKLTDFCSITQMKRKFKSYLEEINYKEFKLNNFPHCLVVTLVILVEEFVSDSLKYLCKNEVNGLYTINQQVLKLMLNETNKYDFLMKYTRKYSSSIRYNDSLFFNLPKVLSNLETKFGEKLMLDNEAKNMICYYLLSLQYDFTNLALSIVKYSNRKTLNKTVLLNCCLFILDTSINSKIKLKLDSLDNDKDDENENEDVVAVEEETEYSDEEETETEAEAEAETEAEAATVAVAVTEVKVEEVVNINKVSKIEKELEYFEELLENDQFTNSKASKSKKVNKQNK